MASSARRLPPGWNIVTVDELKSTEPRSCAAGPFGSSIGSKFFVESGVPVIRGGNLSAERIRFIPSDFAFITEEKADTFKGAQVKSGDLVFTCWGTLGQVGLIPRDGLYEIYVISNKQLKLRTDAAKCSSEFLYYYFTTHEVAQHIRDIAIGSAVPGINLGLLKGIEVPLPPVGIQRKIAAILTAYDELLENTNQRISLLELMAEQLYRNWFIRLKFPGWESEEFRKGVPIGWQLQPFSSLVKVRPKETVYAGEEKPYIGMDRLSTSTMYFTSEETREGTSGAKFRNRDVLFPRITPSVENGKRGFVMCLAKDEVAIGSTEFIVLREQELCAEYIYFLTCSDSFRKHAELSMIGASGRQRVQEDCFDFFLVATPPPTLMDAFQRAVSPFFEAIQSLSGLTKRSKEARDTLLNRLMSGKLNVADLDIAFPDNLAHFKEDTVEEEVVHA